MSDLPTGDLMPLDAAQETAAQPTWLQAWWVTISRPSAASFQQLVGLPSASWFRAYLWVLISLLIGFGMENLFAQAWREDPLNRSLPAYFLTRAAFGMSIFVFATVFAYGAAHILGGRGSYADMAFAQAAGFAAHNLASSTAASLPDFLGEAVRLSLLSGLIGLYGLVLVLIAVKAAARFSWKRSLLTFVISGIITATLVGGIAVGMASRYPDVEEIRLGFNAPKEISRGQSFTMEIDVTNTASETQILQEIDTYLGNANITEIRPVPVESDPIYHIFRLGIPPGETLTISILATGLLPGPLMGEIDVCINTAIQCQTINLAEPGSQ